MPSLLVSISRMFPEGVGPRNRVTPSSRSRIRQALRIAWVISVRLYPCLKALSLNSIRQSYLTKVSSVKKTCLDAMPCGAGLRSRRSRRCAGQRIVGLSSGLLRLGRSLYLGSGLQPRRAPRRRFVLAGESFWWLSVPHPLRSSHNLPGVHIQRC